MATVRGFVERIIYKNADNGYTVFSVVSNGLEYTCVGTFQFLDEGEYIEVSGDMSEHKTYGEQLIVKEYEIRDPEDTMAIERYLGSGAIKGIGASLAARIVRKFKADTFRIIEEEPERLAEVKGISDRKAIEIASQVEEKRDMRKAMLFLSDYGITTNLAVKIYNTYGNELYKVIRENPYRMADDLHGVGFKIADEIARKVGIRTDSDFRIRSGLMYVLLQATSNGHTYLPYDNLLALARELIGVEPEFLEKHIMDLAMDKKLFVKEVEGQKVVYYSTYYYMELNVARMLTDLNIKYEASEDEVRMTLRRIEKTSELELDELQKKAVEEAIRNGLLIITGGPGTGKTTTINAVISYFELEGADIRLAAPTGRAAKRMTEATGYEAQTIHRMLEIAGSPDDGTGQRVMFERNENNPIDTDVIIIDEMSMVDINLMNSLLKAVQVGTRLILVGDVNQLPSVGPGNVLRDIIQSESFNVVKLNKIFRQASKSDIIVNAHKINRGEPVALDNKSRDFLFLKRDDANIIISAMITLITKKLPGYVDAEPYDIQVLTPMRKGLLGVDRLNGILQEYLNPKDDKKVEKEFVNITLRENDKVMQIKNNYQLEWETRSKYGIAIEKGVGVFNGDMGIIREINLFAEQITIEFEEGKFVEYTFKQVDELELAYAITIHKSQGSEYPAVVLPILSGPRVLMNNNLLYTAVTRARKCVTIVGSSDMFNMMASNRSEMKRFSSLDTRIREMEVK